MWIGRILLFGVVSSYVATTYQDLFSNQSFDNSTGGWCYSHQVIQSLQELNL